MTTLMSLPSDVIDIILSFHDISFEDIINLRCVCKELRDAAKTTDYCFQKKKFFQRWPSARKYYIELHEENEQKNSKKNEQKDKKHVSFIETGIYCVRQLRNYIAQMMFILKCDNVDLRTNCELNLHRELQQITEFTTETLTNWELVSYACLDSELGEITGFDPANYTQFIFYMDEIEHLLTQPLRAGNELLEGYCYIKLFDYLRNYWRPYIMRRYIEEKSHHKELLEECAAILAQQLQPQKDVSYWSVKLSLNMIALEALNFLRKKHPDHSIFMPNEYFSYWENGNIDDNYWSETEEGTQIMDTLVEYMFGKLAFRSTKSSNLEYMCIDYVLENKYGNTIILYIIFESVARRLGLRCDIITNLTRSLDSSTKIYLFWIPRYNSPASDTDYSSIMMNKEYKDIIRCFDIRFDEFPDCINQRYISLPPFYEMKFREMLEFFLRNQSYVQCDLFSGDYSTIHQHIKDYVPKTRPKETKFAVGMIVKHGDESTNCPTGVIIGWYQTNFDNKKVMQNISDKSMPLKCSNINATEDQRTYYLILTKCDKLCHVEEGAVNLTKPFWIENKNIYRYFSKFRGTHYVPNKVLAKVYPHDAVVTAGTIFVY